jgi:hypothetical protein
VLDSARRVGLVPVACGALAVGLAVLAMLPSLRPAGWSLTVLPRVDTDTPMGADARAIDPSFHTVHPGAYDGQFYWGTAIDPLGTGRVHRDFDSAPYRYGHPLYGWLGWVASGGQGRAVPAALAAVGLAAMLAAGMLAGLLGRALGGRGLEGLFVALNPGLLYAAAHDLAEPLCVALVLGALLAHIRGRRHVALALFALMPLAKEPLVLVPLAVAAWGLLRRRTSVREAALTAATVVPACIWWAWTRIHFGALFTSVGDTVIQSPLAGWRRALLDAGVNSYSSDGSANQLGETTVVLVIALGGLLLVAALVSLRLRSPIQASFVPLVLVVACLSPAATVNPRDLLRVTSVVVALVPFVLSPLRGRDSESAFATHAARRPP